MFALSQILHGLFADKKIQPISTDVQTALEPVHEQNVTEGGEFIDDFATLDEQPEE
ncbi:MAG TPA: hypothetical protein VGD35_18260 [Chitinophaga sp.]